MNLDILGWLGSSLLAVCAVPQAYKCFKQKHSEGLSWLMLLMLGVGDGCLLLYVIPKNDAALIFNYTLNFFVISVIIYYKLTGSKNVR